MTEEDAKLLTSLIRQSLESCFRTYVKNEFIDKTVKELINQPEFKVYKDRDKKEVFNEFKKRVNELKDSEKAVDLMIMFLTNFN
jgi:hypothetical protein